MGHQNHGIRNRFPDWADSGLKDQRFLAIHRDARNGGYVYSQTPGESLQGNYHRKLRVRAEVEFLGCKSDCRELCPGAGRLQYDYHERIVGTHRICSQLDGQVRIS